MRLQKIVTALACTGLIAAPAMPAYGQSAAAHQAAAPWVPATQETGTIKDLPGLKALAIAYPDSGTVRLRLLTAQYLAQDFNGMLDTLRWLNQRGYVFGEVSQQQVPKLIGADRSEQARALMIPSATPVVASIVEDIVPEQAGLTESVLRDPVDDRLIVTSVTEGGVFGKRRGRDWDGFRLDDVANISGIALVANTEIIWLTAGHIDGSEKSGGFTGLIGLERIGRNQRRIAAPQGANLSDITVAQNGTIYASDPVGGGIYYAKPGDTQLETLIAPGTFRSPQGLAVSAEGAKLYVSDYRYGMAIIDLETKSVSRLVSDVPLILDGVDGLWRHGNRLIAMQNGTSPMRISAFELSADGMRITGHQILEQAHPEWTEPLSGNLDGDALLYIGNGQWDKFVQGELAQDKKVEPTQIRRLKLPQ